MNINELMAQADREVDTMCNEAGMWSLGMLREALMRFPSDMSIIISDGNTPGTFSSYRGYYRFIAFDTTEERKSVGQFLRQVEQAIGETFTGYKGGEYLMTENTPIWYSDYGHASGWGLVGFKEKDGYFVLVVEEVDKD